MPRPHGLVLPEGSSALEIQLFQALVFLFLVADVLSDHRFVAAYCGDEISPGPEVLPHEVALALAINPSQMNRTLALEEAYHLRHRVFPALCSIRHRRIVDRSPATEA